MFTFLRSLFVCVLVLPAAVIAAPPASIPVSKTAKPIQPALPSTLDVTTFAIHSDGDNYKMVVTAAPSTAGEDVFGPQSSLLRVDVSAQSYSIIYNHQTEEYTGLEHSNYTYWQFSWPEIRAAVESSTRYASRLQELNLSGISTDSSSATTNTPTTASIPDTSGYVWKQTNDHKQIAGLDCTRWTGDTVSGDNVEAWCFNGPLPKIQAAVDRIHAINEPMALVAIRTLIPPFVFPVFGALVRGGVTPVVISWGAQQQKNSFAFVETKTRTTKPDVFSVPKLYMKTTLVSMDGLLDPPADEKTDRRK